MLRRIEWRQVVQRDTFNPLKKLSQFFCHRRFGILVHGNTAARFRSLFGEGPDNQKTVFRQIVPDGAEVVLNFALLGQEVKGGPVVPEIILLCRFEQGNIANDPVYFFCPFTEPCFCARYCRLGNIQDGDVFKTQIEQVVNKITVAAAHIDDPCRMG